MMLEANLHFDQWQQKTNTNHKYPVNNLFSQFTHNRLISVLRKPKTSKTASVLKVKKTKQTKQTTTNKQTIFNKTIQYNMPFQLR